jgi:intracellular septation protein
VNRPPPSGPSRSADPNRALRPPIRPLARRLGWEFLPLLIFFAAFRALDIWAATAALMAATLLLTVLSYVLEKRFPVLPAVASLLALVFGGLTLALEEEVFIKVRLTVLNLVFAALLLGSLATQRPLVKTILAKALDLDEAGWRGLTLRTGLFLVFMAGLNEVVWRNFSTATWVNFKVLGVIPLDILFAAAMWPYVKRHYRRAAASRPSHRGCGD